MEQWKLSRLELNEIHDLVVHAGLLTTDFTWSDVKETYFHHLDFSHRPTGSQLTISSSPSLSNARRYTWWPKITSASSSPTHDADTRSWPEAKSLISKWLLVVRENHEAPDLWRLSQQERAAFEFEDEQNTPFTEREVAAIAVQLGEVRALVGSLQNVSQDQADKIDRILAYAEGAARRVGRIDWKNIFISTLLKMLLAAGLDAQSTKIVMHFAIERMSSVLGWVRASVHAILPPQ
jgi:hypothetical protein